MFQANHGAPHLNAGLARKILQFALDIAKEDDLSVSVALLDEGGNLLGFLRQENAFLGSIDAAQAKARTALFFHRESGEMQMGVESGKLAYLCLPNALPIEGGVPLIHNDKVIGAIGVSGARSSEDGVIARRTAAAFCFGRKTDVQQAI